MHLRQVLIGLLTLASIAAALPARADDEEICGVVVLYRQPGPGTIYRGVHYGEIDVVTHEDRYDFVTRLPVNPNDLIPLNPNQEFSCVP